MLMMTQHNIIVEFMIYDDKHGNPYKTCKVIGDFDNRVDVLNVLNLNSKEDRVYEFATVDYYSPNTVRVLQANGDVFQSTDGNEFKFLANVGK